MRKTLCTILVLSPLIGLAQIPTPTLSIIDGFYPTERTIEIQWSGLGDALGAIIERSENDNTNFVTIDTVSSPFRYRDSNIDIASGLDIYTTYYYRVRHYTPTEISAYSNEVSKTTGFSFTYLRESVGITFSSNILRAYFVDLDFDNHLNFLMSDQYDKPLLLATDDGSGNYSMNIIDADNSENYSLRWMDYDSDNLLDYIKFDYSNSISFFRGTASQSFEEVIIPGIENYDREFINSTFADLNNDRILDFVLPNGELMLSNSASEYSMIDLNTGTNGRAFFIDAENDNDLDIIFVPSNPLGSNPLIQFYRNNTGVFSSVDAGDLTTSFAVDSENEWLLRHFGQVDVNNDGFYDIVMSNETESFILLNDKSGVFNRIDIDIDLSLSYNYYNFLDIDNDGWVDLIGNNIVYKNIGGSYDKDSCYPVLAKDKDQDLISIAHHELSADSYNFGDLNDDGLFEILNGRDEVLYTPFDQTTHSDNHPWFTNNWIKFDLTGFDQSNSQAIGARVDLHFASNIRSRQLHLLQTPHQMDLRPHFGLGEEAAIDSVKIYWPSGLITKIDNPAINTVHIIHESVELSPSNLAVNSSILTGQGYSLSFDLENAGHINASTPITYQILLSDDEQVDSTDLMIKEATVNSLALLSSSFVQTSFEVEMKRNNYNYLLLFLDTDSVHKERNEFDNLITYPVVVNNAPSDILISNVNLIGGAKVDSTILEMTVEDLDSVEVYTFSLVDGAGSEDNIFFELIDDQLIVKTQIPLVSEKSEFNIRLKVEDGREGTLEKAFVLTNIVDQIPPFYKNLNVSENSVKANSSTSITASVDICDNVEVESVKVYVNGISGNFDTAGTALASNTSTFSSSFDASGIDDVIGLAVYFEAQDIFGNISQSDTIFISFIHPEVSVPIVKGTNVKSYQIIAFPISSETSVSSVLEDDLGVYDKKTWRLFTYQNGQDLEYKDDFNNVKSGNGYWLISKNSEVIDMPSLTASSSADINLSPGWNQIGNPFVVGLDWNEVINHNVQVGTISVGDLSNLVGYDSQFEEKMSLSAYEGAFVEASHEVTIHIPKSSIKSSGRTSQEFTYLIQTSNLDEDAWFVPFVLENEEYNYSLSGFGMHPDANDHKDVFDLSTLPKLSQFSEIEYIGEWIDDTKLTRSIISTQNQANWDFVVNTNLEEPLLLRWDNSGFGSNLKELYLIDKLNNELINMKLVNNYLIQPNRHKDFKVVFGERDYILSQLGQLSHIGNVFPNPSNGQINIPFIVGTDAHVFMELRDINGRIVEKLMDKTFLPGFHEFQWSRNESQISMKDGVYILESRIRMGEKVVTQTIKVVLQD